MQERLLPESKSRGVPLIYFIPFDSMGNQYIAQMRSAIIKAGYRLAARNTLKDFWDCNIVHFNWFENIGKGSLLRRKLRFLKKLLMFYSARIMGKKIVMTFHNKVPHESVGNDSRFLLHGLLRHSNKIMIHCHESYDVIRDAVPGIDMDKIKYMPHPNYISVYSDAIYQDVCNVNLEKKYPFILLFMGLIRPYKNIEVIIRVANQLENIKDIHFLICGQCISEEYGGKLSAMIKGNNISTNFSFVGYAEIPMLMRLSNVILLPYNTRSALNSGAAYLAFSFGHSVISTEIGTIKDLADPNLVYCYEYSDDEDHHAANLKAAIMRAYSDFTGNNASFSEKGTRLKEIMEKDHSVAAVAKMMPEVYGNRQ